MPVKAVFSGGLFDHQSEREALLDLAGQLSSLDEWFVLFVRFYVNGAEPDVLVVKRDCLILLELKACGQALVQGEENGPWYLLNPGGSVIAQLNEGRDENPYQQLNRYWREVSNYLRTHGTRFFAPRNAKAFGISQGRPLRSLIVFSPALQTGSRVPDDFRCPSIGLDQLGQRLLTEKSTSLNLTLEETFAMAKQLGLTRWKDIETLASKRTAQTSVDWDAYRNSLLSSTKGRTSIPRDFLVQGKLDREKVGSLLEITGEHLRVCVIGPAGIGKTTSLRALFAALLEDRSQPPPILIELNLYEPQAGGLDGQIRDALQSGSREIDISEIPQALDSPVTILLDGLNEVAYEFRSSFSRELGRHLLAHPKTRWVITSRLYDDLAPHKESFVVAELQPLTDSQMSQLFELTAKRSVNLSQVDPRIRELARVPLYSDCDLPGTLSQG